MGDTAHIEEQAALWVSRSGDEGWSPADEQALNTWLSESTTHRVAYLRLREAWRRSQVLRAVPRDPAPAPVIRWRWPQWVGVGVACGMALLLSWWVAASSGWSPLQHELVSGTPVGGHRTLALGDGTRVELNTDTRLRTRIGREVREAWLDRGEAYFDVAHETQRTFVVHAATRRITVLGTRFSVRLLDDGQVSVVVADGRVRVDSPGASSAAIELERGSVAAVRAASMEVQAVPEAKLAQALSWRRSMLLFDDTTLAEAVVEFNRYNQRKLVISDAEVGRLRIGGSFEPTNVDAFARLMAHGMGLKVVTQEQQILLTR